jgi:hypothetical protein
LWNDATSATTEDPSPTTTVLAVGRGGMMVPPLPLLYVAVAACDANGGIVTVVDRWPNRSSWLLVSDSVRILVVVVVDTAMEAFGAAPTVRWLWWW